jgi:hypothetical protein
MTVRSDVRFVPCGQLDYELVGGSSGAQNHPFRTGSEPVPNRDVGLEHPELLGGRCRVMANEAGSRSWWSTKISHGQKL